MCNVSGYEKELILRWRLESGNDDFDEATLEQLTSQAVSGSRPRPAALAPAANAIFKFNIFKIVTVTGSMSMNTVWKLPGGVLDLAGGCFKRQRLYRQEWGDTLKPANQAMKALNTKHNKIQYC